MKTLAYIAGAYLLLVGIGEYTISTSGPTGALASIGAFPSPGSALSASIGTASMIDVVGGLGLIAAGYFGL